jgi:hypothetical protein
MEKGIEIIEQLQLEMGKKIKEELSKEFKRVDVGYVNLDYSVTKGYVFYLYAYMDNYDYIKVNVNFVEDATVENYVHFILESVDKNENITEHFASAEERYIIDILNETNLDSIYVFDGCLYADEYEIGLNDIDYISYDKINSILEIYSDEEKFEINLKDETIEYIEDDIKAETTEIIDNSFMHKICNEWNQIEGIWGILLYNDEDECLRIKDLETGNINELAGLDDINYIKLDKAKKKIYVEYDEDECGFSSFELSLVGIEY